MAGEPKGPVVGIDPGFTGAIGVVDGNAADAHDMPIMGSGKQKYVDGHALYTLLKSLRPRLIVIEQVAARPGQGVATMFRFGMTFGAALAVALSIGCRVELVVPAKWKRRFGLIGMDKEASRALALRKFPALRSILSRKKDNGRAEAVLLAEYGAVHC